MTLEKILHDLNNALVAVYGFADLIAMESHDGIKQQNLLKSANRIRNILEDLNNSPGYQSLKHLDFDIEIGITDVLTRSPNRSGDGNQP
jgi:hypothetical protein